MKRGAPLKRGAPPKRHQPIIKVRRGTARSTSDFSDEVRQDLIARSNGWCEVAVPGCAGRGTQAHHRLRRAQGGKGTLKNGLWVCRACHSFIHDHPAESFERGWLIRSS